MNHDPWRPLCCSGGVDMAREMLVSQLEKDGAEREVEIKGRSPARPR
tara:strand:+ start:310 stop:450 length:141 start_codon:yes stop_codon:yes gene_type:complete